MDRIYSADELATLLPPALDRLWEVDRYDPVRFHKIMAEGGLERISTLNASDQYDLRVRHDEEDPKKLERKIRTAINKVLGSPVRTDKRYGSGPYILTMHVYEDELIVRTSWQFSLKIIRNAAADWLAGMPLEEWKQTPAANILFTPANKYVPELTVYQKDELTSVHVNLDSAQHPGGDASRGGDERIAAVAEYFADLLGEQVPIPGTPTVNKTWKRKSREIVIRGYRSTSDHTVDFRDVKPEKPEGSVLSKFGRLFGKSR